MLDISLNYHGESNIDELDAKKRDRTDLDYGCEGLIVGIDEDGDYDADEDEDEDDYDELEQFAPLLENIRLEVLPAFALSIRKQKIQSAMPQQTSSKDVGPFPLSCTVLSPPLAGSYNILFQLKFSDGVRWLFKVPIHGFHARFDGLAAQALESEAMTMRLIRRQTGIPVPEVYAFDSSMDNDIKCPFIMMEHIQGQPLSRLWFQQSVPKKTVHQFRKRVLKQLAAAMAQLRTFEFRQGGSLRFNNEGEILGMGPSRVADLASQSNDCLPVFCAKGPFNDTESFLKFNLDRVGPMQGHPVRFNRGVHTLLGKFMEWIPSRMATDEAEFVLSHPDYALQNILVSEDGELRGIIDWDGVAAVPRCVGQYPLWLMRDWDLANYNYNIKTGTGRDPYGQSENTPEQLQAFRELYAGYIGQSISKVRDQENVHIGQGGVDASKSRPLSDALIRKSILAWSLTVAADDNMSTVGNMGLVFDEIVRLTNVDHHSSSSDSESKLGSSTNTDSDCSSQTSVDSYEATVKDPLVQADESTGPDTCSQETASEVATNQASSDDDNNCNTASATQTSIHLVELTDHNVAVYAHEPLEDATCVPKMELAVVTDEALPKPSMSHPIIVEGCASQQAKPICYRIRDALRFSGKVLHKKNSSKAPIDLQPLPAVVQPVTATACPSDSSSSNCVRVQSAFDQILGILRNERSKKSEINNATYPALIEDSTEENSKPRPSRFSSAFRGAVKLLRKQKSKVAVTESCGASTNDGVDPRSGEGRSTFQKAIGILLNKKSKKPTQDHKPQPAMGDDSATQQVEPRHAGTRSIIPPSPSPLENVNMEIRQLQESPNLPEENISQGILGLAEEEGENMYYGFISRSLTSGTLESLTQVQRAEVNAVMKSLIRTLQQGSFCPLEHKSAEEPLVFTKVGDVAPVSHVTDVVSVAAVEDAISSAEVEEEEKEGNEDGGEDKEKDQEDDPDGSSIVESEDLASIPAKAEARKDYSPEFFDLWSVAHGIADGELCDEFWQRLERGFALLVESL